jgi:hypothetical protein
MSNDKAILKTTHDFEREYPIIAENFKRIQEEDYTLFAKKMLSYGLGNISVNTQLANEAEINLSLTGIWFRTNDKMARLKQLVLLKKDNPLEDEPVEDAYKDLSVYGIISRLVKGGFWKK